MSNPAQMLPQVTAKMIAVVSYKSVSNGESWPSGAYTVPPGLNNDEFKSYVGNLENLEKERIKNIFSKTTMVVKVDFITLFSDANHR